MIAKKGTPVRCGGQQFCSADRLMEMTKIVVDAAAIAVAKLCDRFFYFSAFFCYSDWVRIRSSG